MDALPSMVCHTDCLTQKQRGFHMDLIKILLAIFLPPVGAYLQVGLSTHFWINIVLTLLGGIPGVVHALWLVLTKKRG